MTCFLKEGMDDEDMVLLIKSHSVILDVFSYLLLYILILKM